METPNAVKDVCIIGAGPAGLQAGYLLGKKGRDVVILERADKIGAFFRAFPRHRQLISINKVNTGLSNPDTKLRYDWNSLINDEGILFPNWSRKYFPNADDYVDYLEAYAETVKDKIVCDADVTEISKEGEVFTVLCADGTRHRAKNVIVATGVSRPWDPGIEGFETVDNYFDFDIDPELYENKRVLILGKGNSSFETADSLIEHAASIHVMSPNPVKFAWQTHFVGNLRAVNNNFLDTYQLKSQNAVIDARVFKIEFDGDVYTVHAHMNAAEGHDIVLTYDKVIACTGFRFDNSIFAPAIKPELRHFDKFPAMNDRWENETVPGLFFAGTIMQCRDYKKTMSGFVHGFRHNVACLVEFVNMRVTGEPYPSSLTKLDGDTVTGTIIDRISTASGIFLQPGFLADVILLDGPLPGRTFRDVPLEWARHAKGIAERSYLTVTLEYGDFRGNSLHVKREHNVHGEEPDAFIHPVIRYYVAGRLVDEVHLADHLDADWRQRSDRDPNSATVLKMTFRDAGTTLSPADVAERQIRGFLERTSALTTAAASGSAVHGARPTAAE